METYTAYMTKAEQPVTPREEKVEPTKEKRSRSKSAKFPVGTHAKFGVLLLVAHASLLKKERDTLPKTLTLTLDEVVARLNSSCGCCLLCSSDGSPKHDNWDSLTNHPKAVHAGEYGKSMSDIIKILRVAVSTNNPLTQWPKSIVIEAPNTLEKRVVKAYADFMHANGDNLSKKEHPWNKSRSSKKRNKDDQGDEKAQKETSGSDDNQ